MKHLAIPSSVRKRFLLALGVYFFGVCLSVGDAATAFSSEPSPSFERDVWPILKAHCLDCHGAGGAREGALDLRQARLMLQGGDSGAAIVAGAPGESYLLSRVEAGEMPPGEKKVSPAEIDVLRKWIAAGAPTLRPETDLPSEGIGITPEERQHWAFLPLARPATPSLAQTDRVGNPIDAFIGAKLEERQLTFSPAAERRQLLRRVTFDLTGLPPTREETAAFLADDSPAAYEKLVDRLLASPRYGERWARHWLDVAGYADSEGGSLADAVRPEAYRYRDYVIRAFNADKPFDRFIHEQLAGDELAGPRSGDLTPEQIELLSATGFLRMAPDGTGSGGDSPEARQQVIADTLKIVSNALLGVSVACAQCHDHRYDPILHTDYYRLRAIFEPAFNAANWRVPDARRVSLFTDADRQRSAEIEAVVQSIAAERAEKQAAYMKQALEKELEKYPEAERPTLRTASETAAKDRTPEQKQLLEKFPALNITPGVLYQYLPEAAEDLKKFDARIESERAKKPVEQFLRVLAETPGEVPTTHLFHRGDYRQPKQPITPGDLLVASAEGSPVDIPLDDPALPTTGRRLAYAKWLTSGQHPLVGRTLVNRVWMHHFGRGLSATPSEFGKLGEAPTHPELLDWLATEFAASGWSLKSLHRTILTSTTYQQSSRRRPESEAIDSDNRLLSRAPVRRIEAEALRDGLLAVSGSLNTSMFGPAAEVAADDAGQPVVANDQRRRGIYVQARRTMPASVLATFDAPDMLQANCERRERSTVAGQSLLLLNSEFALAQAGRLAETIERQAADYAPSAEALSAIAAAPPRDLGDRWSYGSGLYDEAAQRVTVFHSLPHFTGSAYQGGPNLPDANTNWVLLRSDGGHPGDKAELAAIRRFTAARAVKATISGTLAANGEAGNGVRGRIVSSRLGLLGEWRVQKSEAATAVSSFQLEAGDTLDFVVDCDGDVTSDSFTWPVTLALQYGEGDSVARSSVSEFSAPLPSPAMQVALLWETAYQRPIEASEWNVTLEFLEEQLALMRSDARFAGQSEAQRVRQAMTNLCQTILGSNEFLYVD